MLFAYGELYRTATSSREQSKADLIVRNVEHRIALRAAAAEQQAAVGLAAKADVAGAVGVFSAEPTPLQLKDTANRTDENAWPERALRRRGRPKR